MAYTEPNIVSAGASFDLMAVTDQTKSAVRFTVTGGGSGSWETSDYTTESQSAAGLPTNTVRLFKKVGKVQCSGDVYAQGLFKDRQRILLYGDMPSLPYW